MQRLRFVSVFICMALCLPLLVFESAAEEIASGYCGGEGDGTNLYWRLTDDGTLTIIGNGEMKNQPNFGDKSKIKSVVIGDGVTSIGEYAFYGCSNLYSVELPNGITNIGNFAFGWCCNLISIVLPNGISSISNYMFQSCSKLTSITIPNSVTSIKSFAFSHCSKLSLIVIPNSVIVLGNYAFNDCTSLTSITIPNSVTVIYDGAFLGCTGLTSIEIPNGVAGIGKYVFDGCSNLSEIIVDSENKAYCSKDGVLYSKDESVLAKYPEGKGGAEYVIPNTVNRICASAFLNCASLNRIEIPNGVKNIEYQAFACCTNLSLINIPNGITSIESWAFADCSSLASVNIPDCVNKIGGGAFFGCSSFESIIIPISVEVIGPDAFSGCNNMTDIYCEIESQPEGWEKGSDNMLVRGGYMASWLGDCPAIVHWGYKPIPDIPWGDLDNDGIVDESETISILNIIKSIAEMTQEHLQSSDYNKDGTIDIRDFNYIYNKTLNK